MSNSARTAVDYPAIEQEIRRELAPITDSRAALTRAVEILKTRVPDYQWVGIYELFGNELVLGPFAGKPSPHTLLAYRRDLTAVLALLAAQPGTAPLSPAYSPEAN